MYDKVKTFEDGIYEKDEEENADDGDLEEEIPSDESELRTVTGEDMFSL